MRSRICTPSVGGASRLDYILGHHIHFLSRNAITENASHFYTSTLVHLKHCYTHTSIRASSPLPTAWQQCSQSTPATRALYGWVLHLFIRSDVHICARADCALKTSTLRIQRHLLFTPKQDRGVEKQSELWVAIFPPHSHPLTQLTKVRKCTIHNAWWRGNRYRRATTVEIYVFWTVYIYIY